METEDLKQEMPYEPAELEVHWSFIDALGDRNEEIAAAILFHYSQEVGYWVGINIGSLDKEISSAKIAWDQWLQNLESVRDWNLRNRMTLGIYGLFYKEPVFPETPIGSPFGVPFFAESATTGLRHLIRDGLAVYKGGYIFPTPEIVKKIAEMYKKDTRACL